MSLTAPTFATAPPAAATTAGSPRALLACAGLACALVLGSGAVRWWQARRVEATLKLGKESRFPLDSLPMQLGDWKGERTEIDPQIVARTGSNDLITRRYVNQTTGVALDVIVLHGPASDIFIHTPTVCYPQAGFAPAGEVAERSVRVPDGKVAFRSAAFAKGDPGKEDRQEVYFSWRYNGRWQTTVNRPKEMERVPGMYKVQVARRILPNESRTLDNPCESFLEALIPDLEARVRGESPPEPRPRPSPRDPSPPEGSHR
jgi:hypothetical protein